MKSKFLLVHYYHESCKEVIVAFSDYENQLRDIMLNHPRFGSQRHSFYIVPNNEYDNVACCKVSKVKDENLISICQNVASYLSFGEYSLLRNSYKKAYIWFSRAKDSAFLGSNILENY